MKKIFALFCIMSSLCFTACMDDSDKSVQTLANYFTITGVSPNYTLYSDDGYLTVNLDPANLPTTGMSDYKRGFFYVQYDMKHVQTDANQHSVLNNAIIVGGEYIPVAETMTKQQAEEKKVTAADSTFEMQSIEKPWYVRGYITVKVKSYYFADKSGDYILPTHNLVFDEKDITENAIKYTIHCNRHPKENQTKYGPQIFLNSFYARYDLMAVPGSDSINVTISGNGFNDVTFKVGRTNL